MQEGQILRQLEAISAEIAEGQSRENVPKRIVGAIHGLGFGHVRLDLLTTDGKVLVPVAWRGFGPDNLGEVMSADSDPDFQALQANPVPQVVSAPVQRGCVPVLLQGKVIGKITVAAPSTGSCLDEESLGRVMPFAHLAALAQAVLWAGSLESLQETTRAIIAVRDRHALLTTIVKESVRLLGAKSGGLYEYRSESDELVVIADFNRPQHLDKTLKRGEGLAGNLLGSGKTSDWTADYSTYKNRAKTYEKETFGAVLVVLLVWEGKEIGALYVDDTAGREFSEMDIRLLRLFADQAAICLAQADLFEKDQRKLRRLGLLAQVTQEMVGNLDAMSLRKRLETIAKSAADVLEAETSGVFRVRGNDLVLEASIGHQGEFEAGTIRLKIHNKPKGGLTGWIAHSGSLFNEHGPALKEHYAYAGEHPSHTKDCFSLLAIPLKRQVEGKEELIGLLRADNKKGSEDKSRPDVRFTQEDEEILTVFADAAVIAIESAELVDRLKEQRDLQERLIASSPDGIIAVDQKGLVTEFNRTAEEILGYKRAEVVNQAVSLLYHDAKEPRRIGRMLHESPDGHVRGYETFVRSQAEEPIPIRHSSTWLFNAEGKRIGSVGYFEDLRQEQALKRRESLLLQASNVVAQEEALDDGLQKLASMMVELLRLSFCCILIKEGDGDSLILRAASRRGDLEWNPGRQPIELADWPGLPELLRLGVPAVKERSDPKARPNLEKLARTLKLAADEEIRSLLVVPLKIGDRVVGQLDLGDLQRDAKAAFPSEETELVSAIAGQITILVDRMELLEKRTRLLNQLAILHRISDYIQAADKLEWVLLTVLTGVTASFGLGFNRAMLMLVDETGEQLVGEMGVGELDEQRARAVWEEDEERGANDFEYFQRLLENREIGPQTTTVGRKIGGLRIPAQGDHLFAEVLISRDFRRIGIEEFKRVPQDFIDTFHVTTPLAIAPLVVKGQVIGILVADNKFNQAPINSESCKDLMTFAATAAVVIDNRRLIDQKSRLFEQIERARKAAEVVAKVTLLEEQGSTLQSIAEEIHGALDCSAVVLYEYDQDAEELVLKPAMSGVSPSEGYVSNYKRVYAMVARDERYVVHDVSTDAIFKDSPFARTYNIQSFVAFPLKAAGRRVGVMFVNYHNARHFMPDELANMELFANQAAVAIRNAQLLDEHLAQLDQQKALADLSKELLTAASGQEMMNRAVEFAAKALNAELCNIVLPNRRGRLIFSAAVGWPRRLVEKPFVLRHGKRSQTGYTIQQGKPVVVYDYYDYRQIPFHVPRIVLREKARSGLSVPMFREGRIVGAMLVHTKRLRNFTPNDEVLLSLIANQTATALERAQQYDESTRKGDYLDSLYKASKTLAAQVGLERRQILEEIVQPAMERIVGVQGPKPILGTVQSYNEENDELILESVYPRDQYADLVSRIGERRPVSGLEKKAEKIGVVGRAVLTGKPQLIDDVERSRDYIVYSQQTRSELAVPLLDRGKVIGVLNVESDKIGGFDEEDLDALQALAELVVVAIQNSEARRLISTRTTLIWMGTSTAVRRHEMGHSVGSALGDISLLKRELQKSGISGSNIDRRLLSLKRTVKKFKEERATGPLDDPLVSIAVNDELIRSRKKRIATDQGRLINVTIRCEVENSVRVRGSVYWLQKVLDILINNAVAAVAKSRKPEIVLGSGLRESLVEIYVSDNGKGIPKAFRDRLLFEPVRKAKSETGYGVGLLIAQSILQIYNGRIAWEDRDGGGTTMKVSLPLEQAQTNSLAEGKRRTGEMA